MSVSRVFKISQRKYRDQNAEPQVFKSNEPMDLFPIQIALGVLLSWLTEFPKCVICITVYPLLVKSFNKTASISEPITMEKLHLYFKGRYNNCHLYKRHSQAFGEHLYCPLIYEYIPDKKYSWMSQKETLKSRLCLTQYDCSICSNKNILLCS